MNKRNKQYLCLCFFKKLLTVIQSTPSIDSDCSARLQYKIRTRQRDCTDTLVERHRVLKLDNTDVGVKTIRNVFYVFGYIPGRNDLSFLFVAQVIVTDIDGDLVGCASEMLKRDKGNIIIIKR